jgi:hypothetical protein
MFKLLGLVVALYTLYAVLNGEVFARSGQWGKIISQDDSPRYFWGVIAIYAALALALMTCYLNNRI